MSTPNKFFQAINESQARPRLDARNAFLAVLSELTDGLEQAGVGATIRQRAHSDRMALVLYPKYRPQRTSSMLIFQFAGNEVIVSGETPQRFAKPEELEKWLLDFIHLDAFRESIEALKDEATQPVEARLRVDYDEIDTKRDVLVEVSPDDQRRLAEAEEGQTLELAVSRIDFPGNPAFLSPAKYCLLESAGYYVEMASTPTLQHAALSLKGTRRSEVSRLKS